MSNIDWSKHFPPPTPITLSEEEQLEEIFKDVIAGSKSQKYDRQLRLWGPHGQAKIDKCSVLLLNASAVGCEVLKNLILPGIGQITVVDHRNITPRDLGVNFYLEKEELGKGKANCAARILLELNPDVKGNFLNVDAQKMVEMAPDAFDDYDFIIASQLDFKTMQKLNRICQEKRKYLIGVKSIGMCGYIRVYGADHTMTETKMDNPVEDLRLYESWEDIQKFADLQVLKDMDDKDHSHTPYPVILLQLVKEWKAAHGGKLPQGGNEAKEFMTMIENAARKFGVQENFSEAYDKAYTAYNYLPIPEDILKLMDHPKAQYENINDETGIFWILVHGLSQFFKIEGGGKVLPLQGKVHDMHSDTDRYVRLQSLYRRKHRADVADVLKHITKLCEEKKLIAPTKTEVSFFCKHCYNLRVIDYRTFDDELDFDRVKKDDLIMGLEDGVTPTMFYFCMRAADIFFEKNGKYPGDKMDDDVQKEANELYEIMKDLVCQKFGIQLEETEFSDDDLKKFAACWTRFGNAEIHTISSMVGGVASQELIKLCTMQRLPLNHTWIYNGMDSKSVSLEL